MGREPLIFAGVVVLTLVLAFAMLAASAQEGHTNIPVDCGNAVCVLPKNAFQAILEAHNALVDENRRLKGELAGRARSCPGDKGA